MTNTNIKKIAQAARNYLNRQTITEKGYGYMTIPVSANIRKAIDEKYLTVFALIAQDGDDKRDIAFIVSKEFQGDSIALKQKHIGLAIGRGGCNISKLVKRLSRRITFTEI